jgi:hypothetical protein
MSSPFFLCVCLESGKPWDIFEMWYGEWLIVKNIFSFQFLKKRIFY